MSYRHQEYGAEEDYDSDEYEYGRGQGYEEQYDDDEEDDYGYDDRDDFNTMRKETHQSLNSSQETLSRLKSTLRRDDSVGSSARRRGNYAEEEEEDINEMDAVHLRQKIRQMARDSDRREAELLRDIDRLQDMLAEQSRSTEKLKRQPLQPPSRSTRAEFLETRGEQARLDRKLEKSLNYSNTVALRNKAIMEENSKLRREIGRLRKENTDLLLFAKDFQTDQKLMQAQIVTNVAHRAELAKRLNRISDDKRRLEGDLTKMTDKYVQNLHDQKYEQDLDRWSRLHTMSRSTSSPMMRPTKSYRSRNIRVEDW